VVVSLAEYIFGLEFVKDHFKKDLEKLRIKIEPGDTKSALIFKFLPGAKTYEKGDLIKKYAVLKRFLAAA